MHYVANFFFVLLSVVIMATVSVSSLYNPDFVSQASAYL